MKKSKTKNKKHKSKANHYDPRQLQQQLIALFEHSKNAAYTLKQLYKKLHANNLQARALVEAIVDSLVRQEMLQRNGQLIYLSRRSSQEKETLVGRVDYVNPEFLYVVSEDGSFPDIRVSRRHAGTALDGDTVRVQIHRYNQSDNPEGEIVEIIKRFRTEFVGVIELSPRFAFVIPDKRKMYHDIFIRLSDTKGAKHGEKVVAAITGWDEAGKNPFGVVTKVLGKAGDHETEMHSIMAEYDLPMEFPEEVLAEAEQISETISPKEIATRRDFRGIPTFTIDPEDAQDFDDALSFRLLENGNYEVGVHIADVTHYVLPSTLLEREAYRRATSVYLVDRCVPMLPEKLSNQLCSLRPHEDKLTFSAVFEITERGRIVNEWFGKTIIRSQRRFTYEEAQQVLESGRGEFAQELWLLNKLAKIFQRKRVQAGAILFETTEVKFRLDARKKPIEIFTKVRKDAHKLIEEFMLLANRQVAEFVYQMRKGKNRNVMVYRTHDRPDEEKVENFANFAKQFGHTIKTGNKELAKSLNELAALVEGKPEQNVLQNLAIRAMAKAKYTTDPLPHFGLAFKRYTHFTSPIRRYPDMMVHRLLQHYLEGGAPVNRNEYEERCKHSSNMEKRAADAERASIKYKQVELIQDLQQSGKLRGKLLSGVVTGVTEWGIYVELTDTRCEGMVRMSDIPGDYYEHDAKNYCIVGRRYRRTIRLGDKVQVRIKATNLEKRTIDLLMEEF
ncbi:MAG: ribonuclease R [Cytophagales bacterium]|nr:ribonuclease R [Bernardetiaceae bacterium]MDW8205977.1 ribonuclease R [Cytophagales bacterium]